jgi:hypothetical protein
LVKPGKEIPMTHKHCRRLLALAISALILTETGVGQEFHATLTGRVTDAGGAAVLNAKVTVKNIKTGEVASAPSTKTSN